MLGQGGARRARGQFHRGRHDRDDQTVGDRKPHDVQRLDRPHQNQTAEERRGDVIGMTPGDGRFGVEAGPDQLDLPKRRTDQEVDGIRRSGRARRGASQPRSDRHPLLQREENTRRDTGLRKGRLRGDPRGVLRGIERKRPAIAAHRRERHATPRHEARRDAIARRRERQPQDVEPGPEVRDRRRSEHADVDGAAHVGRLSPAILRMSPKTPIAVTSTPAPGPETHSGRAA